MQPVAAMSGPTREARRWARRRLEWLEKILHTGPGLQWNQLSEFEQFLRDSGFPPNSEYFERLARLREVLRTRATPPDAAKRDYAGYAAGCWMQVQSVYDHAFVSVCYDGQFSERRGRIKITHRYNRAGRVDFVEAKLIRSLDPRLHGALRKLVTIREYPHRDPAWWTAPAYALRVLPRELLFLHPDLFRHPRPALLAWLINIGHRTVADLVRELSQAEPSSPAAHGGRQYPLDWLPADAVAWPILQQAGQLEALVEPGDSPDVHHVRYLRQLPVPADAEQAAAATS